MEIPIRELTRKPEGAFVARRVEPHKQLLHSGALNALDDMFRRDEIVKVAPGTEALDFCTKKPVLAIL